MWKGAAEEKRHDAAGRYSRDHSTDCDNGAGLIELGRLPLSYELFDGNRADVPPSKAILRTVERKMGKTPGRVWIFDRGCRERGEPGCDPQERGTVRTVSGGAQRASKLKQFEQELSRLDFEKAPSGR